MKASYLNTRREDALRTLRSNYDVVILSMTMAVDTLLGISGEYDDPEELLYLCAELSYAKQLLNDLCPDTTEMDTTE